MQDDEEIEPAVSAERAEQEFHEALKAFDTAARRYAGTLVQARLEEAARERLARLSVPAG